MSKPSLDACDISPVKPSSKHHTTPRRTRSKASRGDQGIDVHTTCSTPNSQSPRVFNKSLNSPSSSFPYSQENCPDVVWDYTSPKLPSGARKRELKLTVQELLENLNQCQIPECSNQSAPYVKLLENWMSKQTVNPTAKKIHKNKKENRKRIQVVKELKVFLESISRPKKDTVTATTSRQCDATDIQPKETDAAKSNSFAKLFLEGESTDDSTEELWGDVDNSFIIKATQELESVNADSNTAGNQNTDIVSTIPETAPSPVSSKHKAVPNKLDKNSYTNTVAIDMEKYSELLDQLSNVDWDSEVDTDEWDNGFLVEDDALSLIPDEVLTGSVYEEGIRTTELTTSRKSELPVSSKKEDSSVVERTKSVLKESTDNSAPISSRQQACSAELFNSFEDESFEDESLFCQPEVLSQIDEVENMLSQAPKCTPEEIEKKKDEAIKKRLRSRLARKS